MPLGRRWANTRLRMTVVTDCLHSVSRARRWRGCAGGIGRAFGWERSPGVLCAALGVQSSAESAVF
jgi:hypothetical protein